jgi:ABC-type cobalamin transport system permease subunit
MLYEFAQQQKLWKIQIDRGSLKSSDLWFVGNCKLMNVCEGRTDLAIGDSRALNLFQLIGWQMVKVSGCRKQIEIISLFLIKSVLFWIKFIAWRASNGDSSP